MKQKFQIKIFKIKDSHYELKGKSFEEMIEVITTNHKKQIYASEQNPESFNIRYESGEVEDFKFASYCYNQPVEKHYWRYFLPDYIAQDQNFSITKFSYCLFIYYNNNTYCVIGGSGISVIKSFLNTSFGIDVYSRIAKPTEDLVVEIKSRSIANNVSLKTTTFNYNQTVSDTIEFSEIPSVMKIIIRDELKDGFLKDFDLSGNQSILEIGSYFCLRKNISFDELLDLIEKIDKLIEESKPVDLSFFKKIEDESLIKNLDKKLLNSITYNVENFSYQNINDSDRSDIDIVNPSKLEKFYECESYKIRYKGSQGSTDIIIDNRQKLYLKTIQHIYTNLENDFSEFNIKKEIYKRQIRGIRNDKEVTFGSFLNHIIAETILDKKKYFKIDKEWYLIKDFFLEKLNSKAIENYQQYRLEENLLKSWDSGIDEGEYNQQQDGDLSYNLDKVLKDNIEICDILNIQDNKVYFIHVKDGFDVKLRDCFIQLVLAAKRLNIDINDKLGENYLIPVLEKYNSNSESNKVDIQNLIHNIENGTFKICFVLAYRNKNLFQGTAIEKIKNSNSNIAKYSLVNVVKEMNGIFDVKLLDISTINNGS